nr:hypothetical protein [Tanacetum cinerariifolium]
MSYLFDFVELNGGYVSFGGNPKGGKITGKGKIKTVLLRVPRENNMYNVNLKKIIPSGNLTCLFAKATIDESNKWHRRLGHINFKTINKLVKGNHVRGLPTKVFENDHSCVACKKGKQHRASCKTKPVSSVDQPLSMLHMDLFGPTFVKSLNKKSYCLVTTDDYSRFTWVFFLAIKDETGPILNTFLTVLENQLSLRVKVIRSDNETEFKNSDLNQTLIAAARTMLVDSLLPIPFWAEAVNTTCYVQNRVLVTKPHNKTPYELLHEKVDEGFLVGYCMCSKAFRVINSRTRIIQETLHVKFLENKPNVAGTSPTWLFDIDSLTRTMNYQPVHAGNQTNSGASFQDNFDAEKVEGEVDQSYMLFHVGSVGFTNLQNNAKDVTFDGKEHDFDLKKPKSQVILSPSSSAQSKEQDDKVKKEAKGKSPIESVTGYRDLNAEFQDCSKNSSNEVNAASSIIPTVGQKSLNSTNIFSAAGPSNDVVSPTYGKTFDIDASQLPDDLNMPELEDIIYSDDEDVVGAEVDFNYFESFIPVIKDQGGLSQIFGNDFHTSMFAYFLSQEEPKRVHQALKDPSWIEAMQEELLQFKMQNVWVLVDLPYRKRAIDARIEAIRLFLAYASFMGFMVYQMDVKSAFLYGTIKEEVYVCQPSGFEDPDHPDKVYKVVKDLYEKPLLKDPDGEDVDIHTYRSMIGSLMYLTSSRPDIMFAKESIVCPMKSFFTELGRMGYEKPSTKLTFYKAFFSSQWKFLIHTILQSLSTKRTSWNNFSSTMASAIICLSTDDVDDAAAQGADTAIQGDETLDACASLTRRVEHLEYDKVAQALEFIKLKRRVKMLERGNKVKVLKLRRLKKAKKKAKEAMVAGDDQVKGRQAEIYQIDMDHASKVLSIQEDEPEMQEVVDVVTTAKLITEVVTAASESVTAAKEESTTIIPADTKSKDKGKAIMVEEPKPLKKKQQDEMDEEYGRKLHEELNKDIDWNVAIDHFKQKAKEDPFVQRYQVMKKRPQTEAQAQRNIIMYLKNVTGFRLDYFMGMSYDDIRPIFEAKFNLNIEFLLKTKEQLLNLLVERRYPLSRFTIDQMLNAVRLRVKEQSEMSLELLSDHQAANVSSLSVVDGADGIDNVVAFVFTLFMHIDSSLGQKLLRQESLQQQCQEMRILSVLLETTPNLATKATGIPLSSSVGNNVVPLRSDIIREESEAEEGETTTDITPEHAHNITKEAKDEVKEVIDEKESNVETDKEIE